MIIQPIARHTVSSLLAQGRDRVETRPARVRMLAEPEVLQPPIGPARWITPSAGIASSLSRRVW